MLARRVSLAKNNSNDHKSLKVLPKRNDQVPSKKIAKDTWHHCIHGPYNDPRPSRTNFLNARLSTNFNGGIKLLKRVENIEKTFEYNRVDKTLSYLRSTCKNTCLLFKNHNPQHFQTNSQNILKHLFEKIHAFVKYSSKELLQG